MSEACITIGESRPLVKEQKKFLGGHNAFISLMHNQIVELFQVLASIIKFYLEPRLIQTEEKSYDEINMMTNDQKIKYLLNHSVNQFSNVDLNGFSILGISKFLTMIEDSGTIKLCENTICILNEIIMTEGSQASDMILGSTEQWSDFEKEKVPEIKKALKTLIHYVNWSYVIHLNTKIDEILEAYLG